MAPHLIPTEGHVVGLVDLGTNSVRLLVVRINTNRSYTILNQHKVMVRLGEGEFVKQRLRQEAMERTILVLRRFADMARNLGAEGGNSAPSATHALMPAEICWPSNPSRARAQVSPDSESAPVLSCGVTPWRLTHA